MSVRKEVPLYCDLCSKEFSGVVPAQQHFMSEAHRRKEDQKKNSVFQSSTTPYWCDPCHLQCNSADQFAQHIHSPRHEEIVRRAFSFPGRVSAPQDPQTSRDLHNHTLAMNNSGPQRSASTVNKDFDFDGNRGYCYLCDIDLNSQQHAQQHLRGSKHQKKKKQSEGGGYGLLTCSICKVPFSCEKNAQEHLASAKHMKRKRELEQQDQFPNNMFNLGFQNINQFSSPSYSETHHQVYPETTLADVPVYSKSSSLSDNLPKQVASTPLTSSITLLGASGNQDYIGATKQCNSDVTVPYTFDGKQGYCNICQVDFTSPQNAQQHLDGSKHQKAEKIWKQGGVSSQQNMCTLCNVVFSGPESAQQHYASEKHEKRSQLPVTNFTIQEPEKPAHTQKVNLMKTPQQTPGTDLQTNLPLNIQPESTQILVRETAEQHPKEKGSLSDIMQLNFKQPRAVSSAPYVTQSQGLVHDEGLGLSVHGGSLPTPLAVGVSNLLHYENHPSSVNQGTVFIPDHFSSHSPMTTDIVQNTTVEDVKYHHADQHLSGHNHSKAVGQWEIPLTTAGHRQNATTHDRNIQPAANQPYRFDGNRGWCNCCSIELTSNKHANQHLSGKNHAKALARWETANGSQDRLPKQADEGVTGARQPYEFNGDRGFCHVCKIELTSEAHARQHLSGKPHEKALFRWNFPFGFIPVREDSREQPQQASAATGQGEETRGPAYVFTGSRGHCFVCNIELTSREHATQHLQGRNHVRAEERSKIVQQTGLHPLECKVCFKSFSGQESAGQHFASAKHRNKVAMKTGCLSGSTLAEGWDFPKILMTPGQSPINQYMCEVCQCPLNSFEQLSIHKKSPNHLKTVEKMNRYIAVNTAAGAGDQGTSSTSGGSQDFEETKPKEQYADLWSALQTGELTTVRSVVANAEPGEIISSASKRYEDVPITTSANLVMASGGQGSFGMRQSTSSTAVRSLQGSNTDAVETHGFQNIVQTRTSDLPPRRSSAAFNPIVGSPLITPAGDASRDGLVKTTDVLPIWKRTGVLEVNTHDMTELSSQNDYSDTGEHHVRSGIAIRQPPHNPLRNQNKHRGNMVTINSYDLDTDEEDRQFKNRGLMPDVPDDGESFISYVSNATNILGEGAHASHTTTDNNPSVNSATRRTGENSLFSSETESSYYPSSNFDLLSGYSEVGPLPNLPADNPYKGHFKYYCQVCKRPMNTEKDWTAHLESRSHQQRMAVVEAPVRTDLGQIHRVLTEDEALDHAYTVTSTIPRSYQVELFCKTMEDDRVIFLPTGTGKTLVSVMTLSCMLKQNPRRPVLFLVDKVLLVLQQSKYIIKELGEKIYERLPLDGAYPGLKERTLKIATMCGNLLPADSTPLYRHDVIVTTAAYADNLLMKKFIHWTDFSLVVFDEAHHCVKKHPFNRLLEEYHRPCPPEIRPKVLGLTASPAGRDSVQNTYNMLQELFANLGGATVAIVQRQSELEELAKYQSNASLVVNYIPYSNEERDFRLKLEEYICHCYLKLAEISNLEIECNWDVRTMKTMELSEFAENLDHTAIERFLFVIDSLKPRSKDPTFKVSFDFLTKHSKIVLLALTDMDGCGIPGAVADLQTLANPQLDGGFHYAKQLQLPCDGLEEAVKRSAHAAQIHQEFEDNPLHISLYTQLLQTLTNTNFIDWKSNDNPMTLILVRERAHAHRLSNFLKQTPFAAKNDLKITSVVGHGSGQADGGMKVKQQKRVLDGVRNRRYHIIVATSVAEEGVDIPECELVVCMNPPSTVTGLVQMRGRARKKGSFFVILCKSKDEENKMKNLLKREKFMLEAAQLCIQPEAEQ